MCQSSLYSDDGTNVPKRHSRNFILKKSVIKLEQAGQNKARRSLGSNLNREVLKVNRLNLSVLELSLVYMIEQLICK